MHGAAPYLIMILRGDKMFFSDEINKKNKLDIRDISSFLKDFHVDYDFPEKTFVIRDKGKIVSTGSVDGNILKYFFTAPEYKGEGTISIIYNSLLNYIIENGHNSYFVFTTPNNKNIFQSLGLNCVHQTSDVALLEGGFYNYDRWIKGIKARLEEKDKAETRGAIVMNCNPMTLGHKFLIDKALEEVDSLLIFVVEEDKSVFPFENRWQIMKAELKAYTNIELIASGPYIISQATFPTYFLKEQDDKLDIYTRLDAGIFGQKIAKDLEIDKRFLGTEPTDKVTAKYNENIKDILEKAGIEVKIVNRVEMDGKAVSASTIRALLKEGKEEKAYKYLPKATIKFLESEKGREIINKL